MVVRQEWEWMNGEINCGMFGHSLWIINIDCFEDADGKDFLHFDEGYSLGRTMITVDWLV